MLNKREFLAGAGAAAGLVAATLWFLDGDSEFAHPCRGQSPGTVHAQSARNGLIISEKPEIIARIKGSNSRQTNRPPAAAGVRRPQA